MNKTIVRDKAIRLLPCSDLVVTDVWKVNLPLLTSESPIRMLDVNQDGIDDAIFGFGTGKKNEPIDAKYFEDGRISRASC